MIRKLGLDDLPTIQALVADVIERREVAARHDLDDQWARYAHTLTVLDEIEEEITGRELTTP